MAERLAPLTVVAPITSRPEQTRRRRWRWPRRVAVTAIIGGLALAGTVGTAHFLSIERHAHEVRATSLVPLGLPARVLVVIARPGQELPMAGTIAALHEAGTSIALLSMTAETQTGSTGDAGPDASGPPGAAGDGSAAGGSSSSKPSAAAGEGSSAAASDPAAARRPAVPPDVAVPSVLNHEVAGLGLDAVATAGFLPGELMVLDPSVVIERIRAEVAAQKPSAIITVSDTSGSDTDSQAVAGYTQLVAAEPRAGVSRVWTVSRGAWERDWQALAGDVVDQKVPTPQVAVRLTGDIAGVKSAAMGTYAANGDEQAVTARYPAWDRIPSTLYLRFWDREYFALAWGDPVE